MAATLTTLRDRVEATLQDAANARWATSDLDEAIRRALEEFSSACPREVIVPVTLAADGREVDLSALTGRLQVTRVWFPYTAADPEHPPRWAPFEVWGDTLYLDTADEPSAGEVARLWYSAPHTLNGLDGAAATTLPADAEGLVVGGAAGQAALQRAVELSESLNVDADVVERLTIYGRARLDEFRAGLRACQRQAAARDSGVSGAPRLDRWDERDPERW